MKEKIQKLIGLLVLVAFVCGAAWSFYNRSVADPKLEILNSTNVSGPISGALFWHEKDLEKTAFEVAAALTGESAQFTKELYATLSAKSTVNSEITTMSDSATKKMIELGAYKGSEPDVWKIAADKKIPYIFKVTITNAEWKGKNLRNVTYQLSLYQTKDRKLIWQGKIERLAGFFGGMPDSKAAVSVIESHLQEAKIIK